MYDETLVGRVLAKPRERISWLVMSLVGSVMNVGCAGGSERRKVSGRARECLLDGLLYFT
jgi:hypothetical protein